MAKAPKKQPSKKVEIPESRNPAKDEMAKANFDPLLESIKIAKGEALTEDHPFLTVLEKWARRFSDKIDKNHYNMESSDIDDLLELAEEALTDSYVPISLRATHIRDLLNYVYPKLKSTEHTGQIQHDMKVQPLTVAEMRRYKKAFNDKY